MTVSPRPTLGPRPTPQAGRPARPRWREALRLRRWLRSTAPGAAGHDPAIRSDADWPTGLLHVLRARLLIGLIALGAYRAGALQVFLQGLGSWFWLLSGKPQLLSSGLVWSSRSVLFQQLGSMLFHTKAKVDTEHTC